jgi:hypothetical protein
MHDTYVLLVCILITLVIGQAFQIGLLSYIASKLDKDM